MCGLTGFLQTDGGSDTDMRLRVAKMSDSLRHRGPDDEGTWTDGSAGIALGFRRLAIIDVTPAGHQPMVSSDERWVLMLNGEIYNFGELRRELQESGSSFRSRSDTEVILEGFVRWGLDRTIERLNGMFAIAAWDRRQRVLHLARDRFGEKPLYYGWMRNVFLFGSEIKALRAHPAFHADVDRNALALYSRFGYVPAPHSIFRGISKLPAATRIEVTAASREHRETRYWSPLEVARAGLEDRFRGSVEEGIEELDAQLRRAVGLRMVSDVPLGAFLSGGIDSSLVVAQMQAQSPVPVRTFSIGFEERQYNEAPEAAAVARHLGTDHTEAYVSPADTIAVIPRLPSMYDEPFADPSQIPTHLVSAIARRKVTVSLSGDGGDEIFGGYGRYALGRALWRGLKWAPRPFRAGVAAALLRIARFSPPSRVRRASDKLQKLAEILSTRQQESLYLQLMSLEKSPETLVSASVEPPTAMTSWPRLSDMAVLERMMYLDTVMYLPEDILVKVDRASMAVSLESRAPFLDPDLFAFAWRLPLAWKFRGGKGKWILRKVLEKYVPVELFDRPKMGFGVPIDSWLRGPLRDWAEGLLSKNRLASEGFFEPARVREKWEEHVSGARNWHFFLWDILMFQAWLEDQSKQGAA
ncbi:MAG TPA: asparagine synthase (glutamine-hydrolyzing), partial [Thermoanaerobaculia bacterium]|nr:asparagine synthase (glutamine-hydrolyzing) [Thermoanaerobaculia bacterium]